MTEPIVPLTILLHAFPGIPEDEAQELIDSGEVHTYPSNIVLCHEDAFESTFYIILEGEVEVTKAIGQDQVRFLNTLTAGDFFGEMAIIHRAPRAATVATLTPTTVLEIRKEAFNRLLRRSASLARAMVHEVSRRLRENDAMAIEDLRLKAGELASAYQQLAELDYARQEFLTTIAHELRTPLTAASGFLEMLQGRRMRGEGLNVETQRTALESVQRNIQQIVTLVNDILFLQEMDLILSEFFPVDVDKLMESLVNKYDKNTYEHRVEINLDIAPDLPEVPGDAKSLERAFSAILDNAVKYSEDGDQVSIRIEYDDNQVWAIFEDHGVGIAEEILPRIFDRFFHVDQIGNRIFGGVGLGLSIARQVIEQHNGRIKVDSEVNIGTVVTVFLNREV